MEKGLGLFKVFTFGIMIGVFICFIHYWWIGAMSMSFGIDLMIVGGVLTLIMVTRKLLKKGGTNGS